MLGRVAATLAALLLVGCPAVEPEPEPEPEPGPEGWLYTGFVGYSDGTPLEGIDVGVGEVQVQSDAEGLYAIDSPEFPVQVDFVYGDGLYADTHADCDLEHDLLRANPDAEPLDRISVQVQVSGVEAIESVGLMLVSRDQEQDELLEATWINPASLDDAGGGTWAAQTEIAAGDLLAAWATEVGDQDLTVRAGAATLDDPEEGAVIEVDLLGPDGDFTFEDPSPALEVQWTQWVDLGGFSASLELDGLDPVGDGRPLWDLGLSSTFSARRHPGGDDVWFDRTARTEGLEIATGDHVALPEPMACPELEPAGGEWFGRPDLAWVLPEEASGAWFGLASIAQEDPVVWFIEADVCGPDAAGYPAALADVPDIDSVFADASYRIGDDRIQCTQLVLP